MCKYTKMYHVSIYGLRMGARNESFPVMLSSVLNKTKGNERVLSRGQVKVIVQYLGEP